METLGAGKILFDLGSICKMHDVPWLFDVATIIEKLEFKEKPDYNRIKFEFVKVLLEMNICPTSDYNWNHNNQNSISLIHSSDTAPNNKVKNLESPIEIPNECIGEIESRIFS